MIQKVIYRRKAESLAPGRGLLLNYILWGVEVMRGQQQGSASYPPPPGLVPVAPVAGEGIPCSQWETRTGRKSS